jgi:hypothetical protein
MNKFIVILFLLIRSSLCAQPIMANMMTFGGIGYEEGQEIIELSEGGFMVFGTSGSNLDSSSDFYVLRLDSEFNCVWNKIIGSSYIEVAESMARDQNGDFILCGYSNEYSASGYDILLCKINVNGDVLWMRNYGGIDWDFPKKVVVRPDGGYLICGYSYNGPNGDADGMILLTDTNGNQSGEFYNGTLGFDEISDVVFEGGNVYILSNFDVSNRDYSIVQRRNLNFEILDEYISPDSVHFNKLKLSESQIYLAGKEKLENYSALSFWSLHKDDLDLFYTNLDDNGGYYEAIDFVVDDEVIIVCQSTTFGFGGIEQLWQQRDIYGAWQSTISFGSAFDDYTNSVIRCSDGSVVSIGALGDQFDADLLLVKWIETPLILEYDYSIESKDCFDVGLNDIQMEESMSIDLNGMISCLCETCLNRITTYDLTGRMIKSQTSLEQILVPDGIYIIQAEFEGHIEVHQVLISNSAQP